MKKTFFIICSLIFLLATQVNAQLYRYLDTRDGLSSHRVLAIEKDKRGYMWFLTHEGIDRYNGKEYSNYILNNGEKKQLQFPNLNSLKIDTKGGIWVLGKSGNFFKYNRDRDCFDLKVSFAKLTKNEKKLPLTTTYMDNHDRLWLCTKTKQYLYQTEDGTFTPLKSPIHEEITCMVQSEENFYFLGTNHNVYPVSLQDSILRIQPDPILENFHIIQHLYYHSPTHQLIIGTLMDGFYMYDVSLHTIQPIGNMKDVNINEITPLPYDENKVLIATNGNGVYLLDVKTKDLKPYLKANHENSYKMNGDIIKDLYVDEENRIWMAVYPVGVTIFSDKYPEYECIKHSPENPNTLINNQVTYLMEDSDGDIWVATGNGICYYNTRTKSWRSMLSNYQQDDQVQNHVFISLCEAKPGTILVGGYMSGMYRIEKKDMVPRYFSPQTEGYSNIRPDKYIRSIYRDADGKVWAGGYYNFLYINPYTGEMEHYNTEYPITVITTKNRNELWIGTTGGLFEFNKRKKEIRPANLGKDIGSINTIYQHKNQTTYIGTSGNGMYAYDNQTEALENYITTNSALICNNIYCILPGKNPDELMISTENELVCFNMREKIFLNWTQEQGLLPTKFNTAAGMHTSKGVIAFGSGDGLIAVRGPIDFPREFSSKLIFSGFSIQYQQMLPGDKNSPLTKAIDETKELSLKFSQNTFSLDLSSINYDCPSRVLYSWQLEGFFNEWTNPTNAKFIRYTNMDPGKYLLRVRAVLLDDGHTLEERVLHITIEPPFSRTPLAMVIYLIAILIITIIVMRIMWMKKDNDISKEKIQFFINTAHNIRTPLTLIKAPLSELKLKESLTEQGKENLDRAIKNTDILTEQATKLLDFQKEEIYAGKIHVSRYELNAYIQHFLKPFESYAQQQGIQLELEPDLQPLEVWIDDNKMESILHNLVSNALKYTPKGGKVHIKLRGSRSHWFVRISDTGIGISTIDQKKMFKHIFRGENAINLRVSGTGIGMIQTYKQVKQHRGKITLQSKENKGTTFYLRFPIDDKHYKHNDKQISKNESTTMITDENVSSSITHQTQLKAPGNAPTLLIVEDNRDLRDFLNQSLAGIYHIQEASNGKDALELINKQQPDMVLSDIMMPIMRGDDLCRALKNNMETSHIPVILLTALSDRDNIIQGLGTKADNYLVKPFDVDILKANIASILANKELIKQRFARMDYHTEDIQDEVPGVNLDKEFIMKVTETVKKNLGNDFNVDSLCAALNMSRSSFYNKIKALTDQSPSDFVRHIRLNEACTMLKSRKYTVAEVSDRLGYNDPKYFTELFKKHYGMTPSAYMKS